MHIRKLVLLSVFALAMAVSFAAPASATERAKVSQQECNNRQDFTAFFRNNSSGDKYCYDAGGYNLAVYPDLDHVSWMSAGVNAGDIYFRDGADGQVKHYYFRPGDSTGCNNCFVYSIEIYT